jgi:hypothetical protein
MISRIKSIRWQHVMIMLMIAVVAVGSEGCKTTGKLSKKERKAQIEQAKTQLRSIINGTSTLSLEDQDQVVSETMNKNFNDPELNELLLQAQKKLKETYYAQEKARTGKIDAARTQLYDMLLNKENKSADDLETELNAIKAQKLNDSEIDELVSRMEKKIRDMRASGNLPPVKTRIENAFESIASASKAGNMSDAESTIKNTLQYFSSDDVPVLIIISREGSEVDYDKPTTIRRYLEFVKDQKASRNLIDAIQMDSNGKIKALDLIKK